MRKRIAYWAAKLAPLVCALLAIGAMAVCGGCASDALVVTLSDSTNTQVLDLTSNDSLKIPAFSYRTGPYFFCRAKRFNGGCYIRGTASITNETSTLYGLFSGRERKDIELELYIASPSTNVTETADCTERSE